MNANGWIWEDLTRIASAGALLEESSKHYL